MLGPEVTFVDRDYVDSAGCRCLYLAGIDYHRLASHPDVLDAASRAVLQYGLNPTGSRTTTGNHCLYRQLEEKAALFFGTEHAVVGPSGYLSNAMLLQALASEFDVFLLDEKAHASLSDAAKIMDKSRVVFKHRDAQSLSESLQDCVKPGERPLVLTDGVFPALGTMPPLHDYVQAIAPYNGRILVDDAHAMAVVGPTGKGSWEAAGIPRDAVYQTGTLSKGFGAAGGIIPGEGELIHGICEKSAAFTGSTGLALPLAAGALCSMDIIQRHPAMITGLQARAQALKARFRSLGFSMPDTPVPIFSITHGDIQKNKRLYDILLDRGIYPPFIHYPGSPPGGHFRFIITSTTTDAQTDLFYEAVKASL